MAAVRERTGRALSSAAAPVPGKFPWRQRVDLSARMTIFRPFGMKQTFFARPLVME